MSSEMPIACQECAGVPRKDDRLKATETVRYTRLPGLWALCVLYGVNGTLCFWLLFLARPVAKPICALVGLIFYAAAVGLWIRSNVARLSVIVVTAVCFVLSTVLWALAGFGALAGFENEVAGVVILRVSIPLAIVAYLWCRGSHFQAAAPQKPKLVCVSGLVAAGTVLLLSVAFISLARSYADGYVKQQVGFMGVMGSDVTQELRDRLGNGKLDGVVVDLVFEGSAAERAGLKPGDVITAYDGKAVDSMVTLYRLAAMTVPGTEVEIAFLRGGSPQSVVVTVGVRPPEPDVLPGD